MNPRSRYIAHSSSLTHDRSSDRARCSARRSRPGAYATGSTRARRALSRSHSSRSRGIISSDSSATTTSAATRSASSIATSLPAARCAREEDHALGVTRDLIEGLDHLRLASPGAAGVGNCGPQPGVELAAEFLDQSQLVLGDLDIAFRQQHFAMARLHPQELHSHDYVTHMVHPPDLMMLTGPGP